jgi:hypothetical protein
MFPLVMGLAIYEKAKSLNGKKVKISGKVNNVKAAKTNPVEQD